MKCTSCRLFAVFISKRTVRTRESSFAKSAHLSAIYYRLSSNYCRKDPKLMNIVRSSILVPVQMRNKRVSLIQQLHSKGWILALKNYHQRHSKVQAQVMGMGLPVKDTMVQGWAKHPLGKHIILMVLNNKSDGAAAEYHRLWALILNQAPLRALFTTKAGKFFRV